MGLYEDDDEPLVNPNPGKGARIRPTGIKPDIAPWAGGVKAAAEKANPAYEPWKGSVTPASAPSSAPVAVDAFSGANPANVNAPGTRRIPDDRGFK